MKKTIALISTLVLIGAGCNNAATFQAKEDCSKYVAQEQNKPKEYIIENFQKVCYSQKFNTCVSIRSGVFKAGTGEELKNEPREYRAYDLLSGQIIVKNADNKTISSSVNCAE